MTTTPDFPPLDPSAPPSARPAEPDPLLRGTAFVPEPEAAASSSSKVLLAGASFAAGVATGVAITTVVAARRSRHRVRNRLLWGAAKRTPRVAVATGRTALSAGLAVGRTAAKALPRS